MNAIILFQNNFYSGYKSLIHSFSCSIYGIWG